MKKPKTLPTETVDLLMPRLSDEFNASYFYRSAENWCKGNGFDIAAKFFANESADELTHAKKIEKYLVDWNVSFDLPPIPSPVFEFKSLLDLIEQAYGIEYKLYEDYEDTSMKLFKNDLCAFDLLTEFRAIQVKSVAEYSDKLNMLEGVEPTKINLLLLEETLFA